MGKPSFYMQYIAADQLRKAIESIGAKVDSYMLSVDGTVTMHLDEWYVDSSHTHYDEGALAKKREERERVIVEFLDRVPGAVADRSGNSIHIEGEAHNVRFRFHVGEALCERVEVGQREVTRVDPAYLSDAPMVTVTEPIYEWRCSDDILGSMVHKEVAA